MLENNLKIALKEMVGDVEYSNRFKELKYDINESKQELRVNVPADYIKQWLITNRFDSKYQRVLLKLTQKKFKVYFLLNEFKKTSKNTKKKRESSFITHSLNPDYSFESYIVGESNEVAYSATLSISENPGAPAYNPLFIYGGVGLGKTHLLHSIGNKLEKNFPDMNIINQTSEEFMHEYTQATKNKKIHQLVNKFRKNCDILLIDDIQFMSKWVGTQTQFFHIFNHLRDANKQIVMTSDRTPQEIPDIENRLRSRFEWGLVTEVGIPTLETRVKIIKEKSKIYDLPLDDEMNRYLANGLRTNVREIEGVLKKINALVKFSHKKVDLELLESILREYMKLNQKNISIELIKKTIAKFYDISVDDLISKKRKKTITIPRQIAMFLIKELTKKTHKEIGEAFNRDHSTVVNSLKKVKMNLESDIRIKKEIKELKRMLI